jgi:hypothetical protein
MKKLGLVIVIVCLAAGMASAQNWSNGWGTPIQPNQAISIAGTLQLQNGVIAVVSGNATYYVPILTQYIGFIEGLREGAQISIDGYFYGNSVQPTRVVLNGKSYDFTANIQQCFAYCGGGWGNSRMVSSRGGWTNQVGGYGCRW